MAVVLGLVGAFKSGKTTLASELATRLGWPKVSFGEFVRAEARSRGMDDVRPCRISVKSSSQSWAGKSSLAPCWLQAGQREI